MKKDQFIFNPQELFIRKDNIFSHCSPQKSYLPEAKEYEVTTIQYY